MTTADLPSDTMWDSFEGFDSGIDWGGGNMTLGGSAPVSKQTTIQQLTLQVDLSSIDDIQKLKALIAEIEDEVNSNPDVAASWKFQ